MKLSWESEKLFPFTDKNFMPKVYLSYYSTINISSEIYDNDPIYKLLSEYSDIENIQKINEGQITKFLYFNRKNVHRILYDEDKTIHFKYEEINNNLSFYFYLILLINDMPDILNYTYDSKYIKEINNQQEENNDNLFNKIIISKIIIELANDYKTSNDCFNDEDETEINKIINSNNKIIENFIYLFTELDINWKKEEFCSKSIDIVYIEIINALIKNRKIDDYGFISDLIKQLDLENIDFTKIMINKLYEIFNSNKDYINDYLILNLEDFSNEKKVNFYYILLKYILKNSIYIYQIPFFIKTSVNIKQILNSNNPIYINSQNEEIEKKVEFVIKAFTNSSKFSVKIKKQSKKKINKLKSLILDLYNSPSSETNIYKYKEDNISNEKETNNLSFNFISHKSSKEIESIDDSSELHILKYVKKLLSDNLVRNKMRNSIVSLNYYFDINDILKLLNVEEKDKEKFREIITNDNWKNLFKDEKRKDFKIFIENVFYFEGPNEEINKLNKNLPKDINKKSIKQFKDWIHKNKKVNNITEIK